MSVSNLEQEIEPLLKLLRTPAFRFVVVCHNHYSLVGELIQKLSETFPDRPQARLSADKTDFQTFAKTYEELGSGFLFLERFEELVKNRSEGSLPEEEQERIRELTIGLNLKRDRWAKKPIALVVFLATVATGGELPARSLMQKLPDLWSLRSLIVSLEREIENEKMAVADWPMRDLGKDWVEHRKEKEEELKRLRDSFKRIPETETDYRIQMAMEILDLAVELLDLEAAEEAHKAIETIALANPKTERILEDYGFSMERLGDLYEDLNDLTKALNFFERAKDLYESLYQKNPLNEDIKIQLSNSYQQLGEILLDFNDLPKALSFAEKAMILYQELAQANPDKDSPKNSLAESYNLLGEVHQKLEDLPKALLLFEKAANLYEQLLQFKKDNKNLKNDLAYSYVLLGNLHKDLGNTLKALSFFEKSKELLSRLYQLDPADNELNEALFSVYGFLGDIHLNIGDTKQAIELFEKMSYHLAQIYLANPSSLKTIRPLANSFWKLAYLNEAIQEPLITKSWLEKSLPLYEILVEKMHLPEDIKWLGVLKEEIARLEQLPGSL